MAEEEIEDIQEETTEESAEEAVEPTAPKKVRSKKTRVVRRRKSKKEKERPLTGAVRLAVESGKVEFGSRSGLVASKAKLFVIAANAPGETRKKLIAQANSANIPLIEFEGTSMELGSVCGKPFPVALLSIYEEGASNILELAKKK